MKQALEWLGREARLVLIFAIRAYQVSLSVLWGPSCRYTPTCSQYAVEAIDRHGVWRGVALAAWRVLRCHPLARGGRDPVPPAPSEEDR
jgi:putative membrane protein insertion efficiency factor